MLRYLKLSEVADLTVGFVGTMAEHYVESGIPFLRSLNIKPYYISGDDIKYISPEFNKDIKKSILHENDVVIVRTGVPGTCCVVPPEYDGCNCSDVVIVRPNKKLVDPHYLCAYINIWGKKQITDKKVGAIQQHFNVHTAEDMVIALPDLIAQKRVSTLITALNTRIAIADNVCHELESLAKTIYDYWFTQFDFPNAEGKPYRASGGEMVWSGELKREIPEGWRCGNLYEIADFINGAACQNYRPAENEDSLPVVKIVEMHNGITDSTERVSAAIPKKYIIRSGDILFSWSATLEVMYWFGKTAGLNQHIFRVEPKDGFCKEYVYHQLSSYVINFVKMAEARKTTMGHITSDHLEQSRIVLPSQALLDKFHEIVAPIHKKMEQASHENSELHSLRDWLLPMLMNGQATVE